MDKDYVIPYNHHIVFYIKNGYTTLLFGNYKNPCQGT